MPLVENNPDNRNLSSLPREFDRAAALNQSKNEYESRAQSSGVKVEHKILDFVKPDYILAADDDAALDKLYEKVNKAYQAELAVRRENAKKSEASKNGIINEATAKEQKKRAELDALNQTEENARAARENLAAIVSAYPSDMQKAVLASLQTGGKLPEPQTLKDKIKVLFNKRTIEKNKQKLDNFLKDAKDSDSKDAVFNPEGFDKKIAAAEQSLADASAKTKDAGDSLDALRAKNKRSMQNLQEEYVRNFQEKAGESALCAATVCR